MASICDVPKSVDLYPDAGNLDLFESMEPEVIDRGIVMQTPTPWEWTKGVADNSHSWWSRSRRLLLVARRLRPFPSLVGGGARSARPFLPVIQKAETTLIPVWTPIPAGIAVKPSRYHFALMPIRLSRGVKPEFLRGLARRPSRIAHDHSHDIVSFELESTSSHKRDAPLPLLYPFISSWLKSNHHCL